MVSVYQVAKGRNVGTVNSALLLCQTASRLGKQSVVIFTYRPLIVTDKGVCGAGLVQVDLPVLDHIHGVVVVANPHHATGNAHHAKGI